MDDGGYIGDVFNVLYVGGRRGVVWGIKLMPGENFKWVNANSESLKRLSVDRIHFEHLSFAKEHRYRAIWPIPRRRPRRK